MEDKRSVIEAVIKDTVVLVVDHLPARLLDLKKVLDGRYTVHTASSPLQAKNLIQELRRIDVLIVHQDLNGMKGTDFLRMVHETFGPAESEKWIRMLILPSGDAEKFSHSPYYNRIDSCFIRAFDPDAVLAEINRLVSSRSKEKRSSLRVHLGEEINVVAELEPKGIFPLADISENGMFLKTDAPFPEGGTMPFILHLSPSETYVVDGRIVRLDKDRGGVGVEFQILDERSRKAIFRFLSDYVSLQDLSDLKERYPFLRVEDMIAFRDAEKIKTLFEKAVDTGVEVMAIAPQMRAEVPLRLVEADAGGVCLFKGKELDVAFKTSDPVFLSFQAEYATYNFESTIRLISPDGEFIECFYPRVIFYSEKRALKRRAPERSLLTEIVLPQPFNGRIRGLVNDISDGGVSFTTADVNVALLPGTPLESIRIFSGDKIVREERGEVRNVVRVEGSGSGLVRYGLQFGIGRMNIQMACPPELDLDRHPPRRTDLPLEDRPKADAEPGYRRSTRGIHQPEVIRLENDMGEEIVGLLNSSLPLDAAPVPVVIIPPAFGKTKETLFALAQTLTANFHLLGRPLVVIRYDGIRRKGESHKDPDASEPPYEMVNACLSQGAKDVKAVLDWIQLNPKFKADKVILVTFSLSALEVRLALRDDAVRCKADCWISCMGTPELRHLLTRVNCGLDLVEQYQLGMRLGVMPVLGNLVNVDKYMEDGVRNRIISLDQARADMKLIDIPVTWIYGEHDHWVKAEFIRDVMGVETGAPREVLSMPLGHNARTSDDALRMFATVTSLIHRFLHGGMIQPVIPRKEDMDAVRRAEKDRLPPLRLKDKKEYWHRYLVGEEQLLGFDVLILADDYRQLMLDQIDALDLNPQDRLLDLGGGTGNFIECLLECGRPLPGKITIADLIPEAMSQALDKLRPRLADGRIEALCCDIEMNRYLPVRRFLDGEVGRIRDLVDKIENLTLENAEKIDAVYDARLHRILHGEGITAEMNDGLKSKFDLPEYRVIVDFNTAARHVLGRSRSRPVFRRLVFSRDLESNRHLPIRPGCYNKILMSLVLSYIHNPFETLVELRRILQPGGKLVLSTLRPDADASGLFMRLVEKVQAMPEEDFPSGWKKSLVMKSIRSFLNDAQALVDLEEAGTFDFFAPERLSALLDEAGWECVRIVPTFGNPAQGYIAVAKVREDNGPEQIL